LGPFISADISNHRFPCIVRATDGETSQDADQASCGNSADKRVYEEVPGCFPLQRRALLRLILGCSKLDDASVAFIFAIPGVVVSFIPWMVAVCNHKRLALLIGFFNIFFAWTVIGWLFLLVWASIKDPDDFRRDRAAAIKEVDP
jgi:hypothetical protein